MIRPSTGYEGGIILVLFALASCAATLPDRGPVPPGNYVGHVAFREADLRRRSYRIHVPSRDRKSSKLPVVLVLHGAFSTARSIEQRSGFSQLADKERFVAVYPNGYGFLGILRHWNAGHCCGRAQTLELDDVAFVDAVLDDVARRVDIDPARIYIVGESNGAMLAHLYAAVRSDRVAGVAAVIGTIGSGPPGAVEHVPTPEAPVPVVILHGHDDQIIPFRGGPSERDPDIAWVSPLEAAEFWVKHNGAETRPDVTTLYGDRVVRSMWRGGEGSAPVVLYEIRDWRHVWLGPQSAADLAPDDPLRSFDTARVVWQQLRPYRQGAEGAL